jgi:heme/copper-type cytochrome/quinol oxidase subunit 2
VKRALTGLFFALGLSGPGAAENSDLVQDIEALNEALAILLRDPNSSITDTAFSNPELVVSLSATGGVWSVDGAPLSDGNLVLPINTLIALQFTATDLLYEMVFPQLDLSFDAIPGRIEVVHIEFEALGVFEGACVFTCGAAGAPLAFDVRALPD